MKNNTFSKLLTSIPALQKNKHNNEAENKSDNSSSIRNVGVAASTYDIVQDHTQVAAKTFAKPEKYTRSLIDDGEAKKNIKLNAFKSNVEVRDPYTGEMLTLTIKEAKLKYGENWTNHLAEADHKIPLNQRYEDTKNNPWLSNDDIRRSSNSTENLDVVSRKFNNAKRERLNSEFVNDEAYLEKTGVDLTAEGRENAILNERIAQNELKAQDFKASAKNVIKTGHRAGVDAAKTGAVIGGGISLIQNVVAIVKGEKNAEEALFDTAKDTAGAAALSYSTGALGSTISHTLSYSSNTMLKSLSKTNLPSQIAVAALVHSAMGIYEFNMAL